ncbi:acetyl-CoA carboxylase family protein [Brevibacterium samyangense]|uniref:Carboxyl transferase domain-containing protein n=1 Tax=Brevibacterium samyangense TaxID=366888 RepID=A0ABP5ESI7_9MICO
MTAQTLPTGATAAPTAPVPDHEVPATLLVANRGEIAVRIIRTARDLGLRTVAVHPADDAGSLHVALADEAVQLEGLGARAYLDIEQIVAVGARIAAGSAADAQQGADGAGPGRDGQGNRRGASAVPVHPGYGFLAESPAFARACAEAGLVFLGPSPEALELAGAKTATKERAVALGIPVPESTGVLESADPALDLLARHPSGIALKAVAGGGGRGIAVVTDPALVAPTLDRCRAEALSGFGDDRVFAESWMTHARHIEVQCLGVDGGPRDRAGARAEGDREGVAAATGGVVHVLGDRDCSLQRRRQKFLEIAPAPGLSDTVRAGIHRDAARLLASMDYRSLATVEFLVEGENWALLEVNPRIQVEHTVTEAITGLDLVALQIGLALGWDLAELGLLPTASADGADADRAGAVPGVSVAESGVAFQARIGAESLGPDGTPHPAVGALARVDLPSGAGVRVDTWVRSGTTVGTLYDTLLAKVIVHAPNARTAARRLKSALEEFAADGVDTNTAVLLAVLDLVEPGTVDTGWFDAHLDEVRARMEELSAAGEVQVGGPGAGAGAGGTAQATGAHSPGGGAGTADSAARPGGRGASAVELEPGEEAVPAPLSGTIVSLEAGPGELGLIEAMKMHHPIPAPAHESARPLVTVGQTVTAGEPVFALRPVDAEAGGASAGVAVPHPGVDEVIERHERVRDEARPEAVAKVHARGRRTARENLDDLLVPGSFVEYGPLVIAAQRARRSLEDLIEKTSGDGLIGGIGLVDTPAGPLEAVVMSYDYMVLAGTQGSRNHAKTDRLIQLAGSKGLPLVLFAEGGGGRPGDTDRAPGAHLNVHTFAALAGLKGKVPLVTIVSGRCFAGNAALAGVCDVIIATEDANIGMGGPAMIEGGGLGVWRPEDIGPVGVHRVNGVIDVLVADDAAAVDAAQEYLGFFAGVVGGGTGGDLSAEGRGASGAGGDGVGEGPVRAPDPEAARAVVPGDRLRAFDMREAIRSVVDVGSFLELRPDYAPGAITGFARVEGHPVAVIANDNHHLGGAIDVDAARSFVELLEVAEAHRIPVVAFVDTPGFMVGPEAEHEPGVKAFGRLFTTGAGLTVPFGAVIVRKGYGLGAMAMTAGSFAATRFTVAWPSGEVGPMGLEGAVRLGFKKELAAIEDPRAREAHYGELVAESYEQGRAMTAAMLFDIDDVIDPALTRRWVGTLM